MIAHWACPSLSFNFCRIMKLAILFLGILLCFQVILAQEAEEGSGAEEAVEESSGLKLYIHRFKIRRHF